MTGQSVPLAISQLMLNWKEWLIHQRIMLPSRGTSTGGRNGLTGNFCSSLRGKAKSCTGDKKPHAPVCAVDRSIVKQLCRRPGWSSVLLDTKMTISPKYALASKKASSVLGFIERSVAKRSRRVIVPLYSALVRSLLEYWFWVYTPQYKEERQFNEVA